MDSSKEIKIIIVGDFLIFRSGLKILLEKETRIKVCGEAGNLAETTNLIEKTKPDILLIDSDQIDNNSLSTFFAAQKNNIPTILLTNSMDAETHQKYLLLGVDGLVSKEQNAEILFHAIKQVSLGDVYFDRKLMSETIKRLVNEKNSLPEKLYNYNSSILTDREQEVLTLLCRGMKNKVISENLFITETTVRHHLTSIFEKLKVNSRLELVVHAFREGLVEIPAEHTETAARHYK